MGAALETKRLQKPGGCVENPISLRASKLGHMAPCRADPQSIFFSQIIRNFNELQLAGAAASNCSRPPGWLAQLPNGFARNPDIIQQTVVQ
jgi:hypothetical protein